MLLPGYLVCRLCGSYMPVVSWKRGTAALPKICARAEKIIPLRFARAEESRNYERRLKLVIRPTPEDGWYVIQQNGLLKSYLQLSKARLTAMVTTTTVSGFIMAPVDLSLGPLAACTVGTALLSASANTFNHLLETPYDAQMRRTQSRLLVVHRFSPSHAVGFALSTAVIGMAALWIGCNPLTAALGLLNALLYAGVYTPMKRYSIGCTWVGAIVGAMPPLMGYAGATGSIQPASLVLAALLYCWQFPHFNALSWNLRADYTRAGYRVMCAVNQRLCRFTSLRYSAVILLLCSLGAPSASLTKWFFAVESLPFNGLLLYLSYKFYRHPDAKTSRTLFHYTLLHLPLIMMLMTVSKFGDGPNGFE
ncbi:protoheme IX farnesyltransferase [Loa loa]|uniref:Protoheme IX farnesyltransferase, mitochondrial n=2 Tax=Loa loa TaxID=7209 RepID=A0A1S0TW55_LOALO|nr:protoheme IX farnesyltransferase [Loa loa]EFO21312.2 protoheme IX farnesyltransferase [Loa loa]